MNTDLGLYDVLRDERERRISERLNNPQNEKLQLKIFKLRRKIANIDCDIEIEKIGNKIEFYKKQLINN